MTENEHPMVRQPRPIRLADLSGIRESGEAALAPARLDAIPEATARPYLAQIDEAQEKVIGQEFGRAAQITTAALDPTTQKHMWPYPSCALRGMPDSRKRRR